MQWKAQVLKFDDIYGKLFLNHFKYRLHRRTTKKPLRASEACYVWIGDHDRYGKGSARKVSQIQKCSKEEITFFTVFEHLYKQWNASYLQA